MPAADVSLARERAKERASERERDIEKDARQSIAMRCLAVMFTSEQFNQL